MLAAETDRRNLGYLDWTDYVQSRHIHGEAIAPLSLTSPVPPETSPLCIVDYGQCHISLHYCSNCLCHSALHAIQSSLGPGGTRLLHRAGRRDTRVQLLQHRYRRRHLDPAGAASLDAADHEETKGAIDLSFPPGWLVRLISTSC